MIMTTYNWKFVKVGAASGGIKFMLCADNKLIEEFSRATTAHPLEYALKKENELLKDGHEVHYKITSYIKQCNYNNKLRDRYSENEAKNYMKYNITVISIHNWKISKKKYFLAKISL